MGKTLQIFCQLANFVLDELLVLESHNCSLYVTPVATLVLDISVALFFFFHLYQWCLEVPIHLDWLNQTKIHTWSEQTVGLPDDLLIDGFSQSMERCGHPVKLEEFEKKQQLLYLYASHIGDLKSSEAVKEQLIGIT